MTEPDPLPDQDQVEAFRRDGVVLLLGILTPGEVGGLRSAVDQVLEHPGPLAIRLTDEDDEGFFIEDFRRWQDVPDIGSVARSSRLPEAVAALTGSSTVRLHHDHVLVREGGTPARTPWHQDQPYYDVDGTMTASCWLPVDPVSAGECLQVVAGTHTGPWLMPRTFRGGEARWFPEGTLAEMPDVDADPGSFDIRNFAMEPGDALCFNFLSVHAAPGAPPGRQRRVVSLRYVGDDVVRAVRPWRTSPPFPELDGVVATGQPLDHPACPVVWPAAPG